MTNQDILFASLMGVDSIAMLNRLGVVQNELSKRVLPTIPFLPLNNNPTFTSKDYYSLTAENYASDKQKPEGEQFFPLSFSFTPDSKKWLFPFEPMLSISSGNNLIKRNVAKQGDKFRGSVKERWSAKDWDITITGVLYGDYLIGSPEDCYPKKMMQDLFSFLKYAKELYVYSYPLEMLDINKIVIEDYSFPFSKGENVQAFDIKAVSDDVYDLLVKE